MKILPVQDSFQKQNDIHSKDHNYHAGVLFHHLDHYNYDDTVFLKVALQYAQNYVSTETVSRTILSALKRYLLWAVFSSLKAKV